MNHKYKVGQFIKITSKILYRCGSFATIVECRNTGVTPSYLVQILNGPEVMIFEDEFITIPSKLKSFI